MRLCTIACLLACVSCGPPETPESRAAAALLEKQQACDALIAQYRPSLERTFESELRAPGAGDDTWFSAMQKIKANVLNKQGKMNDPSPVVTEAVLKLLSVANKDERTELEYIILGAAMPLEARRSFESYCVAPK